MSSPSSSSLHYHERFNKLGYGHHNCHDNSFYITIVIINIMSSFPNSNMIMIITIIVLNLDPTDAVVRAVSVNKTCGNPMWILIHHHAIVVFIIVSIIMSSFIFMTSLPSSLPTSMSWFKFWNHNQSTWLDCWRGRDVIIRCTINWIFLHLVEISSKIIFIIACASQQMITMTLVLMCFITDGPSGQR